MISRSVCLGSAIATDHTVERTSVKSHAGSVRVAVKIRAPVDLVGLIRNLRPIDPYSVDERTLDALGGVTGPVGCAARPYRARDSPCPPQPKNRRTQRIAVPSVTRLDEPAFIRALIAALKRQPLRGNLTGQLWEQGATVHVVRRPPTVSRGHKQLALRP